MRLEGSTAVITGAGSGMGYAMAQLFALEGANVVAADINPDGVEKLISELGDTGKVAYIKSDVSNRADVEGMLDFAVDKFGSLDILVNNAGIMDGMTPVCELTDDIWAKVMNVNLNGVMYACRHAVGIMTEQPGGGRIVNIASVGGLNGCRAGAAYTASKFAVVGLTRNIGYMYANKNIRCNAICPGGIETNIGMGLSAYSEFGIDRAKGGIGLMPRTGKADEVAKAALFLSCDASSFINGTTLTVDGGWSAF